MTEHKWEQDFALDSRFGEVYKIFAPEILIVYTGYTDQGGILRASSRQESWKEQARAILNSDGELEITGNKSVLLANSRLMRDSPGMLKTDASSLYRLLNLLENEPKQ